ncbi:MAG: DUF6782 family putative metallopeptidase [Pseudomonadota bacterium]
MLGGFKYINCQQPLPVRDLIEGSAETKDQPAYQSLCYLLGELQKSPTARTLIDEVVAYDFNLLIDENLGLDISGFQNSSATLILPRIEACDLCVRKNQGRALMTIAAALRRALKANQGHFQRFDLEPLDYLRLNRLAEADIDAVTVQICWELRTAGDPLAWRQLLAGDKGDLAVVFSNGLRHCPMGQFDGKALRYVFRQWFADPERVNTADHTALEFLDMAIACPDQFEVSGDQKLGANEIRKIEKQLPFQHYLEGINVFGRWFDGLKEPFNQIHLHHILNDMKYLADQK